LKKLLIITLLLVSSLPLLAWGPKGHAVVGDVATSRLTPQARENLRLLLGDATLASIASWADEVRKQHDEATDWHFVDIPTNAAGFSQERDCFRPQDKHKDSDIDHHNCVVDRIEIFSRILGDATRSKAERLEALKWVVHFVGDLHQPLHAIDEARGGNDIKLPAFGSPQCGDYPCNLHWAWDSLLIEHTGLSEQQYVARVEALIRAQNLDAQPIGTAVDWANESHAIARKLVQPPPAAIDEAYFQANIATIDRGLALGGLRLAHLLNDLFSRPGSKVPLAEVLPTGMSISPMAVPGVHIQDLNPGLRGMAAYTVDHPIATALSPDGKTLLVLTSGYNQVSDVNAKAIPALSHEYVFVYDVSEGVPVMRQAVQLANTYFGLAWSPDGESFFASGGSDDSVHVFTRAGNSAAATGNQASSGGQQWTEALPAIALGHPGGLGINDDEMAKPNERNKPLVAGLTVSADGKHLLAANGMNDSVSVVDVAGKKVVAELDLRPGKIDAAKKGVAGGEYPYGVAFKGNDKAYVSSLRDREIVVIALRGGVPAVMGRIKTHGQPGAMLLNKAQNLLFAVADNSDSVVIVDTVRDRVVAEVKTVAPAGLMGAVGKFKGANPTGLALSPDQKFLYVTNGGTNSVAVIKLDRDEDDSQTVALIPTGWYPTSVTVSSDGKWLYVSNAKSPAGPNPEACRNTMAIKGERPCALFEQYILQLQKGSLAAMPVPSSTELQSLTQQVARNNHIEPHRDAAAEEETFAFLRSRIQHVIYILKENRSYDQVLGDLGRGNGDPHLTLFPEALSPNHHALAREFVTLDNFYVSGEVSGVGWNWSTAARTTDFVERTIPLNYAHRGVGYDVEGVNRGINTGTSNEAVRARGEKLDPDELPGPADVGAPDGPDDQSGAGYLWDSAIRAGKSLRNYGFYVDLAHYSATEQGGPRIPLLHDPAANHTQVAFPAKVALEKVTDIYFRGFDMRFADYWRFKEWEREFDEYVKNDTLPALELLRLPHDHFGNFEKAQDGVNTVETMMADNDYAVGLVAEKIAHSKYAGNTLIFVMEDDAQNGPDHVDAHRSPALVIGPYVKHDAVISAHYTTVSLLRTIEEVLGLRPMGLNDAVQAPMTEIFDMKQAKWSYQARVPAVLRSTHLPLPAGAAQGEVAKPLHNAQYWAEKTRGFDFSVEDRLDSAAFNQVLWEGLRPSEPYPEMQEAPLSGDTSPDF